MSNVVLRSAAGRSDEVIEIGDRQFRGGRAVLRESMELTKAGEAVMDAQLPESKRLQIIIDALLPLLQKRAIGNADGIDADFLMDNADSGFLLDLMGYFNTGKVQPPEGNAVEALQTGASSTASSAPITDSPPRASQTS